MKKTRNEIVVGTFVIIGFILLTLIVFFVSGVYLFRSGYKINVVYDYVSILDKGAPIRMAGVRIGEVSKVELFFDESKGKTLVKVKLFIEKGVEIRENYLFQIRGTHVLSEPHIEVTPQTGNAPILSPDAVVNGVNLVPIDELVKRSHEIAEELAGILKDVRGTVGNKEAASDLRVLIRNFTQVSESLKQILTGSEGDMKQTIGSLSTSTESLSLILNRIEKGEGTVGKLVSQDELYTEMLATVQDVKAHPWKLFKKK